MRIRVLAASVLLSGCNAGEPVNLTQTDIAEVGAAGAELEVPENTLDGLTALRERRNLPPSALNEFLPSLPRQSQDWINCDDYLTNNASAGFCEQTVPEAWRPFQFEDKVYFYVPLSG